MLISTSRKPSQKTRSFCKNLSHALGYKYLNRGKMSMRDLQIRSSTLNYDSIALVYEMKGNPSKIAIFSNEGDEILSILISATITNQRLNIKTNEISFKSNLPELDILADILNIEIAENPKENYIHVEKLDESSEENKDTNNQKIEEYNKKIAKIHFYNKFGEDTGLKIAVRKILTD